MTDVQTLQKIRLTGTAPVHCASCYQQVPSRRHVDFGAAYEGPLLPAHGDVVGMVGISVDDLVICEECLTTAAGLIGLTDNTEVEERNQGLNDRLTDTGQRLRDALEALDRTKAALVANEQVKRPPGRPRKTDTQE